MNDRHIFSGYCLTLDLKFFEKISSAKPFKRQPQKMDKYTLSVFPTSCLSYK